jgi:hypothetical protein
MIPNRIVLIARGRHEEATADADCYPGMLGIKKSNGNVIPHNVQGGGGPLIVFKEEALRGLDITQKLPSGDAVPFNYGARGDKYLMLLQAGQNVANQAPLMSAGDGTLILSTATAPANTLYQIVAPSSNITNTLTETTFSNGSYTIPANFLSVGDVLHIKGRAVVSAENTTNTHEVKLYIGSTTLVDSGALQLAATQYVEFDVFLTIRSLTSSGKFIADGVWYNNAGGTVTDTPVEIAATTIDTTVTELIKVTSTASAASTGNIIALQEFQIDLQRAGASGTVVIADEAVDNSGSTGTSGFNSAAFIRVIVP